MIVRLWKSMHMPGESQGVGSQVGCHLWGQTELDTTEVTQQKQQYAYAGMQTDV